MNSPTYIAIDIAKDSLEVLVSKTSFSVANNRRGFKRIAREAAKLEHPLVVCEASGGYERKLLEYLFAAEIAAARVCAGRVRAFATSEGIRAKTDPLDAQMLLRFAQCKKVRPMSVPEPKRTKIADLMNRRTHLKDELTREKNRLQQAPEELIGSITRMIDTLEAEVIAVEQLCSQLVASDPLMQAQCKAMMKIKGVGQVTAWAVCAYLSEITELSRNQLVALAGLAPFNKDSGKKRGKRCIVAGRSKIRKILYMAATTATQHNKVIIPYAQRLKDKGKPHNCVMVAVMRKLILHIRSVLKDLPATA